MNFSRLARMLAAAVIAVLLPLTSACQSAETAPPAGEDAAIMPEQPQPFASEPEEPDRTASSVPVPAEEHAAQAQEAAAQPQEAAAQPPAEAPAEAPAEVPAEAPAEGGAGPAVEHRSAESPDGRFRIETYGVNDGVTAGGLFPPEGLRLADTADETVLWSTDAYYIHRFLWSPDSRYAAVYRQARTHGDALLVDTADFATIRLPHMDDLASYWPDGMITEQENGRPDPYFEPTAWTDHARIRVRFEWFGSGDQFYSGMYTYDAAKRVILDVVWDGEH